MFLIFSDFTGQGPYTGEVEAVLARAAADMPRIRLMSDAPAMRPDLAAYLLAALAARFAPRDIVIAVVDPGVGGARAPLALLCDGVWFVGPDNGLFEHLLRRAVTVDSHHIAWRPAALSASFHGRDLFAPVAAALARGDESVLGEGEATRFADQPDDLDAIVHLDGYGNLVTGRRAAGLGEDAAVGVGARVIPHARTFADVPAGELFWYENSMGLVEIAANRASAATLLGLAPGDPVSVG